MNRRELEIVSEEDLDEIVIDMKLHEATEINNSGKDAQIKYILSQEL